MAFEEKKKPESMLGRQNAGGLVRSNTQRAATAPVAPKATAPANEVFWRRWYAVGGRFELRDIDLPDCGVVLYFPV